jgi:hypothetical protein
MRDLQKHREANKRWRKAHPEVPREGYRRWAKANPEKTRENSKLWQKANPEKANKRQRRWIAANPEKRREIMRRAEKKRYATDLIWRLRKNTSSAVRRALKKLGQPKVVSTFKWLGYSPEELHVHLLRWIGKPCEEQSACIGVIITLENSHLDHIRPQCSAKTVEDVKELNQLSNLRRICALCNFKKNDREVTECSL